MSAVLFDLPHELEASQPPVRRDGVRLMVAGAHGIEHSTFDRLASHLSPGDLVVVNTSGTLAAAVDGTRAASIGDASPVTVHVATELDDGGVVVEVRPRERATGPVPDLVAGERIVLPEETVLAVVEPYPSGQQRLWRARLQLGVELAAYLARVGRPIRYAYVPGSYPASVYQTVFATEPGSAEMPSAGRPFTTRLVTDLVSHGVVVAPVLLHTGVSSQDAGEPPQPERFRVSAATARLVNMTRAWGNRVVAVGTTVTRALESASDSSGVVHARGGWTDLVLGPERPARVVDGLITGWHAPGASHLQLLQSVAGAGLVNAAYDAALREQYRWHEFGDSCLLLP